MRRVNFQNGIRNLGGGSGAAVLTFEIGSTAEATLGGDQGEDLSKGRVGGDTPGTAGPHPFDSTASTYSASADIMMGFLCSIWKTSWASSSNCCWKLF
jgi:hypothetical protein